MRRDGEDGAEATGDRLELCEDRGSRQYKLNARRRGDRLAREPRFLARGGGPRNFDMDEDFNARPRLSMQGQTLLLDVLIYE
jgi:hypothetical protein